MKQLPFILFFFCLFAVHGQKDPIQKKELIALRTEEAIKIDGILDEGIWQRAEIAANFVMLQPGNGDPEPEDQKTEVRIVYDDEGIYVGAQLWDAKPERILRQLSDRDNLGNTDFFAVVINPSNDGQNEFEFFVSAAGVQLDAQVSLANGEDFSWNEVWFSNFKINEDGWVVEIKIPYAALRMPKSEEQVWGLNFHRRIQSKREQYTWNFVDKTKGNISQYAGILRGINNIDPPTRLSFFPFTSLIISDFDGETNTNFAFGMDIKYGITDNFNLVATLIPDFSQAGFDDIALNLGPFEQVFAEQRQFFIEGADILNKGDLFFSRRIGNRPVGNDDIDEFVEENPQFEAIRNPTQVDVLNAVKITGRTQKGLGIAVLNAVTRETEAIIQDTLTLEKKKIITEPLANYNVFVIDQEFNKNSSIGIANTNVLREGDFRDANVTSLVYNIANKRNTYLVNGDLSTSTVRENQENTTGFAGEAGFQKTEGQIRYQLRTRFMDDKYDKNDLGFNRNNNFLDFLGDVSYQIFEPTEKFNRYRIRFFAGHFRRFTPNVSVGNYLELNSFFITREQFAFGGEIGTNIGKRIDYFEPRTEGRFWIRDPRTRLNGFISTDYRKKFAIDVNFQLGWFNGQGGYEYEIGVAPQYRFSDKLFMAFSINREMAMGELGYVTTLDDGTIIFGERDRKELENVLTAKYNFNDRSAISIALRNYWSPVNYEDQYYTLLNNGELERNTSYSEDNDLNFHSWNFDLRYVWVFSRGSELVALYRNSLLDFENEFRQSDEDYFGNVSNLFDQPFGHSFSVKLVYFLDYNKVKTWVN